MKKTPLRSNPETTRAWKQRTAKPLPKTGKRTQKRQAMNRRLNRLGINYCEIGPLLKAEGIKCECVRSIMLSWAHSKKSRFIVTDEDWMEAARCCIPCHRIIEETMSHERMNHFVTTAINQRTNQ